MILALHDLSYRYAGGETPAVSGIDLEVEAGELVLVTGPTGCGKSTLLRLASGMAGRHGQGEIHGSIQVAGRDPTQIPPSERVGMLGFVSQCPADQLIAGTLADEISFGLESAGWERTRIEARVEEMLAAVGLDLSPDRSPMALSGGQQQRLVVAAALAGGAGLLLLDEPLSQLDPEGALQLLKGLRALTREGIAVVLVEHRLRACLPFCDRVVVMESGGIAADSRPSELDTALLERLGLSIDTLAARMPERELDSASPGRSLLSLRSLSYRYPGAEARALDAISLEIHAGETVAIVGSNGAGKSTLLSAIAGHLKAEGMALQGRVVDVPQNPDLALFCISVQDEIAYGPRELRWSPEEVEAQQVRCAQALSVDDLSARAPQALSRGQRLRVAVAAAMACEPELLLLDEPTSGQDRRQVDRMMEALAQSASERAVVFATHDLDLVASHATRVVKLEEGRVVADGPCASVLARGT